MKYDFKEVFVDSIQWSGSSGGDDRPMKNPSSRRRSPAVHARLIALRDSFYPELVGQPPTAEWGSMLAAERNNVFTAFFLVLFPGIMIMINVLAFNLLGDGLRDALDPRLNK